VTRTQIKDLVVENTRREDKEDLILTAITFALNDIAQEHDFKLMKAEVDLALTEDSSSVALPDDAVQILQIGFVEATDSLTAYPLPLRQRNEVLRTYPNIAALSASRPTEVYEHNGQLYLNVKSDGDYILRVSYTKYPPELEEEDSVPLIPKLEHAIVAWCTAYVFRSIQMHDDADRWMLQYNIALRKAIAADERRSGTRVQIEPFPGRPVRPYVPPYLDPFAKRDWD
jgi:hypothetical protein